MKKWLVCFLGLALIHSFCKAQDTIVFQTGEKDAVTVTSFGKKAINFILLDTAYSVNGDRVNYIKYRDGIRYSYKELYAKYDSANKIENIELAKDDSANFQPLHINIGIGASAIESDILNNANIPSGDLGPYFTTQPPVYSATIDYSFTRRLSFGIGVAYQSASDNPSEIFQIPNDNTVNPLELEKITRYNYSARVLYHLLKHTDLDLYAGFRGGVSMWKEQIVSNSDAASSIVFKTPVPSSYQGSYQVLIGGMYPIYPCLGLHLELGFGTPYLFEGGITFLL
jgi:hypothetical protein